MTEAKPIIHCGYIAIVGRPNVGKSTLLNYLIGEKLSIISRKPQTTRHRILGIKNKGNDQFIYIDTPGIHEAGKRRALNRYMNKTALSAMQGVDVIVLVLSALQWQAEDKLIVKQIEQLKCPLIVVINKLDLIKNKADLLPHLAMLQQQIPCQAIVPLSAKSGHHVAELEKVLADLLPESEHCFPADQLTDRSERFLAAELIREKLVRLLGAELPYATSVEIESFKQVAKGEGQLLRIAAVIWVERAGQKRIVIGKSGEKLKQIGKAARLALEAMFECKVFLELWVKQKQAWSDDERALRQLGYE